MWHTSHRVAFLSICIFQNQKKTRLLARRHLGFLGHLRHLGITRNEKVEPSWTFIFFRSDCWLRICSPESTKMTHEKTTIYLQMYHHLFKNGEFSIVILVFLGGYLFLKAFEPRFTNSQLLGLLPRRCEPWGDSGEPALVCEDLCNWAEARPSISRFTVTGNTSSQPSKP